LGFRIDDRTAMDPVQQALRKSGLTTPRPEPTPLRGSKLRESSGLRESNKARDALLEREFEHNAFWIDHIGQADGLAAGAAAVHLPEVDADAIPFAVLREHDAALRFVWDDLWSEAVPVRAKASDHFEEELKEPAYLVNKTGLQRFGWLLTMSWSSLGVVYGDIGTSPIYTVNGALTFLGRPPTPSDVQGVISLILWSVILVIFYKYLILVLSTGYYGKGGAFALVSKVMVITKKLWAREALVFLGCLAFALILADGVITPAVSVLSAIEGILIPVPQLGIAFTNPVAIFILICIYLSQSYGTQTISIFYSPILVLWFIVLGGFGIAWIAAAPQICNAFNPWLGIDFIINNQVAGWLNLSYVILCCTGGEALFADKGHFGAHPIRLSSCVLVLPALILNYLG
jgi:hypothetical protein